MSNKFEAIFSLVCTFIGLLGLCIRDYTRGDAICIVWTSLLMIATVCILINELRK